MKMEGPGYLVRVLIGESDHWEGRALHLAIVEKAKQAGLAGATVLRGLLGFGANSRIHAAHVLRLSDDLPIVVEIVDQEDAIRSFLPTLDEMVGEGLVTLERVEVLTYRHSGSGRRDPKAGGE
jgi:uncharacterized protein